MSFAFVRKSLVNQKFSIRIYRNGKRDRLYSAEKAAIDHLGMTPAQVEKYSSSARDNEGGGK
jgi:hypothetical protein